jgi:hypothetical protein
MWVAEKLDWKGLKYDTLLARDSKKERPGLVTGKKLQQSDKRRLFIVTKTFVLHKEHICSPSWLFPLFIASHHCIPSARKLSVIQCAIVGIQNGLWK